VTDAPALDIVHVCCTNAFAGVERHVSELAAAQVALGHRVAIVGGHQPRVRATAGADVTVLPGHAIHVALRSLRHLTARPDVVNVHMTAAEIVLATAPWLRGVPVVSTRHFASPRGTRRLTRLVTRWGTRRIDGQIAVSQYVADHVDGVSTVVQSGVRPEPDRVAAVDRLPVVLVAQRLEREKHTDVAVRAFAASGLADAGWRLTIAGDGALRGQLERLAASLQLGEAVEFLGHRQDMWELMRSAGVLLAPRTDEAFGLSVVEAMARALPVVAAGSGAHLETVGSAPGAALFEPGNADDAARLLRELADSQDQRESYGARLQAVQRERFTVEHQAHATDRVYREMLL
jgi:glycosyltransferase involved in cell wall biosynthesis